MAERPRHDQDPHKPRDWGGWAAVIASLIGLLALCVSGYTAWLQRQQVRAEVWPYLETGISPSDRMVTLDNKGVGPASVRSLQVFVDGRPRKDWPAVFDALGLPSLRGTPSSTVNGVVISAGKGVQQLYFAGAQDFAAFYARYPRIDLRVCYCSALDECWVLDERESDRNERRHPADSCPIDADHEFVDNKILELDRSEHER